MIRVANDTNKANAWPLYGVFSAVLGPVDNIWMRKVCPRIERFHRIKLVAAPPCRRDLLVFLPPPTNELRSPALATC